MVEEIDLESAAPFDLDDDEPEGRELSKTLLRSYVTIFGDKKDTKWTCNFRCRAEPFTGSYSRIRAHFIGLQPGQKSQGVALCHKVSKAEREKMKIEEAEARRVYSRKSAVPGLPFVPPVSSKGKPNQSSDSSLIPGMFNLFNRGDLDGLVGRFFYGCGIPFNVARSPFFIDMVKGINEGPRGYKAPSSEKLRTTLLDKEKAKIDCALMGLKAQWPIFGISIVSDGWSNIKNQPLINVMVVSGGRAMFISGVDCSGDEKTGLFIAELLIKAIESVGIYNVIQVLTDNASACKRAGDIIMDTYPHIFWSGCMAHTLSLLMKDIAHSKHPSLLFVEKVYSRAKGIVNYIKNHSMVAFVLKKFSDLEVIQVKKTRFGHHYVVLERLFRVKSALISMVLSEDWNKIKSGTSKSKLEHVDVKKTILDDEFWEQLKLILTITKPIWLMIRFCDSDKAVIGEVYQRMGDMVDNIEIALSDDTYMELSEVVKHLAFKRWEKTNLPLHFLAYVLTPRYHSDTWLKSLGPKGEKRKKPHTDPTVQQAYLDVLDRLLRNSGEASIVRVQLGDFVSNTGVFARPQAIQDKRTMPAVQWWSLYGAAVPELSGLAIKVLSQSVNSSCAERAWSTYGFIHSVKRNQLSASRAESLVYVHYNHRLLTRYREDYEKSYRNWDTYVEDNTLDVDMTAVEEREYARLFDEVGAKGSTDEGLVEHQPSSSSTAGQREDIARGKRQRNK